MKIFQTWTRDKRAQEKISLRFYFIYFSAAESAHVSHERAKRKINGAGQKKHKNVSSQKAKKEYLQFLNQKISALKKSLCVTFTRLQTVLEF